MKILFFLVCLKVELPLLDSVYVEKIYSSPTDNVFILEFDSGESASFTHLVASSTTPVVTYRILERENFMGDVNSSKCGIVISEPINLLGMNFYPVAINSVFMEQENIVSAKKVQVEILSSVPDFSRLSRSYRMVLKNIVLNYVEEDCLPGGIIFVVPDNYYSATLPLIDWKEKKGYSVRVIKFNPGELSHYQIRDSIVQCWNTMEPRPEFVLLVGGIAVVPNFSIPGETNPTDLPYGLTDYIDYIPEMIVGRLDVENVNQLRTVVKKIIQYEANPFTSDPTWLNSALLIGADYPPDQMTTPIKVKRRIGAEMLDFGYTKIDTMFYDSIHHPVASDIIASVNRGVAFVNYRGGNANYAGWYYPSFMVSNIEELSNGWKLPVVTSIVCNTGAYHNPACFGRKWITAGDTLNPKGAVSFYGSSSPNTHSRWNNCIDLGFYGGLLSEGIYVLGSLMLRSKLELIMNFQGSSYVDSVGYYFYAYNLLGDPSLEVWTDVPETLIVIHPPSCPQGVSTYSVRVLDYNSLPFKGALVSLYKHNEVKEVGITDAGGYAYFQVTTGSSDTLFVTVTAPNRIPYTGYTMVSNSSVYPGYYSHSIDDSQGNGNGDVNPGETLNLHLSVKNYGNSVSASNVVVRISTLDPLVSLIDSVFSFGSISPGQVVERGPYAFSVLNDARNNSSIRFDAMVSSSQGNFDWSFWVEVKAPNFAITGYTISDGGNGIFDPGETANLIVSLVDSGGQGAETVTGILRSEDRGVTIIDSIGVFGSIPVSGSSSNSSDPFRVSVSSSLYPGRKIPFTLILNCNNAWTQVVAFQIEIGIPTQNAPYGPDGYGYFAYDNSDAHPEAPVYQWIEIDPDSGGSGSIVHFTDGIATVSLPFSFKFYGRDYNSVSVCENGYIVMGSWNYSEIYNWTLPSLSAPGAIVAPFWDYFDASAGGKVCYYFDAQNLRFIVEWSGVPHIHNPTSPQIGEKQTFQLVLYDPSHHQTVSGDGVIVFQYKNINNDDYWHYYATCGIQNQTRDIGLLYAYNDVYPLACAPIINGRAIKVTTNPPDSLSDIVERGFERTFSVAPNPVRDVLYITIGGVLPDSSFPGVKIYDVVGRVYFDVPKLYRKAGVGVYEIRWECSDIPSGIYFVEIKGEEYRELKKVIKVD